MSRDLEDVAQLIHLVQSRLPLREAARTSMLSKSWLHAWSTIPMLMFNVGRGKRMMKLVDVDRILIRYLRDNIPIERFALTIEIENQESASHAEKWIGPVATKTCLKDFYLSIIGNGASFTLPNDILSGVNLTTIRIYASRGTHSVRLTASVINCVSLRELCLDGVYISEEVFHDILSSCSLLVRIVLLGSCEGFKTIKVKNLPRLHELRIAFDAVRPTVLEISDVPNLGVLSYDLALRYWLHEHPPSMFNAYPVSSFGSRVTRLMLGGVITDNTCLDMIKLQFPILESLALRMRSWMLESFHFTCASLKRLSLVSCPNVLVNVKVNAPKLHSFEFDGGRLPSLLFPASSLKQLKVSLTLHFPVDANFFLTMREALALSHNCYFCISADCSQPPLEIDIDDLRRRLPLPPANSVQLSFETCGDECLWERSRFFDALFEICHPKLVFANPDFDISHNNHFCRVMLREVLEKKTTTTAYWPRYLKHVQIRKNLHQKWKSLTDSHRSFLDGSASDVYLEFKLSWC